MAWIKVEQTLVNHNKVLDVADDLEIEVTQATGMMILIWLWALDNAPDGSLKNVRPRSLATAAQWKGDPDAFVEALKNAGLLDEAEDGSLYLHDWHEYGGKLTEKRIAERERSRERRRKTEGQPTGDQETTDGRPTDRPTDDQETTDGKEKTKTKSKTQSKNLLSVEADASTESEPAAADPVPYEAIKTCYHDHCPSYPRIRKLSANRKKAIAARWKEYKSNLATFIELFDMAEASPFLKGQNSRNWSADFDWLMNSDNMAKVLEGKYEDNNRRAPIRSGSGSSTFAALADIVAEEEGGLRV